MILYTTGPTVGVTYLKDLLSLSEITKTGVQAYRVAPLGEHGCLCEDGAVSRGQKGAGGAYRAPRLTDTDPSVGMDSPSCG